MARKDNTPAVTGNVRIANNLMAYSTIFEWPIVPDAVGAPMMHVTIRVRSDGEIFMSLNERWADSPFQDQ